MRKKVAVIIDGDYCASMYEASNRFSIGLTTIRKAVDRALAGSGVTEMKGRTLELVTPSSHEVAVSRDAVTGVVDISSGKDSLKLSKGLAVKLLDRLLESTGS